MYSDWHVQCVGDRIRSLTSEISRVKRKDHPYPEPNIIYQALLDVLEERQRRFERGVILYSATNRLGLLRETATTATDELQDVTNIFTEADRVDSARIPFELLRAVSWVASSLLDENCRVVVRLDPGYNYSIASYRKRFSHLGWSGFWEGATNELRQADDPPFTILVLGFPSAHAGSILLHAIAAHELGHQLREKFQHEFELVREEAISKAKRDHSELLQEYIADNARPRKGVSQADAFLESARRAEAILGQMADDWLSEVFADIIAATLVGPAFLAAFDQIVLQRRKPSLTHPSSALRASLVHRYLKSRLPVISADPVWAPILNRDEPIDPLFGKPREDGDSFKPFYSAGETICQAGFEGLASVVGKVPSPLEVLDLPSLITSMETYIENLAPPSAAIPNSRPATPDDFWRLIYAGWHFRLNSSLFEPFTSRHGWKLGDRPDFGTAEAIIGNLLLHSLESLELRYKWQEFKSSHNKG